MNRLKPSGSVEWQRRVAASSGDAAWEAVQRGGRPEGRCIAAHSAGPTPFLRKAVPPIRSLTMHQPSGLSWMPATCGGEWRSRLRQGGSGSFPREHPTDLQRRVDPTTSSFLLPEHVRDGRGSLGEYRGIDFRGRGSGCQTLSKSRSGPPNTFAHDASAQCMCMGPVGGMLLFLSVWRKGADV